MTGATRRSLLPLCLAVVTTLLASPASAQTEEDRAAARSLATQGISAFNEGRHAEALDLFSRAETLLHAPPHVLYMARAAAKIGQLVRARELYLKLSREELAANAPPAFRDAQAEARDEAKAIEPRLANIVIAVKAPAGVSYKVEMDKKPVSSAVVGVPFPADPGQHVLTASAPGYKSRPVEVTLTEGGKGTAELTLEPDGTAVPAPGSAATTGGQLSGGPVAQQAPAGATTSEPPPTPARRSSWMRPVSYAAMGVGVAGIGVGTAFGLLSRSDRKKADDLAKQCDSPCLKTDPITADIDAKDNSARTKMTISIIGFVAGGVGAVSGVTLFVLSSGQSQSARTVTPYIGLGSAGVSGTW